MHVWHSGKKMGQLHTIATEKWTHGAIEYQNGECKGRVQNYELLK